MIGELKGQMAVARGNVTEAKERTAWARESLHEVTGSTAVVDKKNRDIHQGLEGLGKRIKHIGSTVKGMGSAALEGAQAAEHAKRSAEEANQLVSGTTDLVDQAAQTTAAALGAELPHIKDAHEKCKRTEEVAAEGVTETEMEAKRLARLQDALSRLDGLVEQVSEVYGEVASLVIYDIACFQPAYKHGELYADSATAACDAAAGAIDARMSNW